LSELVIKIILLSDFVYNLWVLQNSLLFIVVDNWSYNFVKQFLSELVIKIILLSDFVYNLWVLQNSLLFIVVDNWSYNFVKQFLTGLFISLEVYQAIVVCFQYLLVNI